MSRIKDPENPGSSIWKKKHKTFQTVFFKFSKKNQNIFNYFPFTFFGKVCAGPFQYGSKVPRCKITQLQNPESKVIPKKAWFSVSDQKSPKNTPGLWWNFLFLKNKIKIKMRKSRITNEPCKGLEPKSRFGRGALRSDFFERLWQVSVKILAGGTFFVNFRWLFRGK